MAEEYEERDFRRAFARKTPQHYCRSEWIHLVGPTQQGADDILIFIYQLRQELFKIPRSQHYSIINVTQANSRHFLSNSAVLSGGRGQGAPSCLLHLDRCLLADRSHPASTTKRPSRWGCLKLCPACLDWSCPRFNFPSFHFLACFWYRHTFGGQKTKVPPGRNCAKSTLPSAPINQSRSLSQCRWQNIKWSKMAKSCVNTY